MVKSFHPRRGKGRVRRRKQTKSAEKRRRSFDWDAPSKGLETVPKSKSVLASFLVLDGVIQSPPGSGAGLIPLFLPRQEKTADQELNQIKTLQREASVSSKNLIALSIYGVQISSDYRLFSKTLNFKCNLISLPVYSTSILYSSQIFLLLSPGTSFFPLPTFQNQTPNQTLFSPFSLLASR